MNELTVNELKQILTFNKELKEKLINNNIASDRDIALLNYYDELAIKELRNKKEIVTVSIGDINEK